MVNDVEHEIATFTELVKVPPLGWILGVEIGGVGGVGGTSTNYNGLDGGVGGISSFNNSLSVNGGTGGTGGTAAYRTSQNGINGINGTITNYTYPSIPNSRGYIPSSFLTIPLSSSGGGSPGPGAYTDCCMVNGSKGGDGEAGFCILTY